MFLQENFDADLAPGFFLTIQGGIISQSCGVLSSGKTLVFNQIGERELVTVDMNAVDVRFIRFAYVQGTGLSVGCRSLRSNSQIMAIQYSINGGVSWTDLKAMRLETPPRARNVST